MSFASLSNGIGRSWGQWPEVAPPRIRTRLVQVGVPLNTVRDLLGHSSIAMTLRYAHLAPDQRREAVAKLNDKPIFALTMRFPWDSEPTDVFYPIDFDNGKGGTPKYRDLS